MKPNGAAGATGLGVVDTGGGSITNGAVGNTTAVIQGSIGVAAYTSSATVTNFGTIAGKDAAGIGVKLNAGGSITNSRMIYGGYTGVAVTGGAATISNSGTIYGAHRPGSGFGVTLGAGGSIGNTGLIQGLFAGVAIAGGGTVANSGGTIIGDTGVYVSGGAGTVTNSGTITAYSGPGIWLRQSGTVLDTGTISGGNGTAITFGGSGNLLGLGAGYSLTGSIVGSVATLELLGSVGHPFSFTHGSQGLTNLQDLLFGPGGNATYFAAPALTQTYSGIPGNYYNGTLTPAVSGFSQRSDVIDLTNIGTNGIITYQSASKLIVTGSNGINSHNTVTVFLDATDGLSFTTLSDGISGTDLIACFCRGTLIQTPRGETPVEDLAIGDAVMTLSGAAKPVRWIGRRAYDGRFITGNRDALPICIKAGALGDGMPARDLWVSPGHALWFDGALVDAEHIVNGVTIVQAKHVERVEYFHIELGEHDVIFAAGAPAETYAECDNRMLFANGAEYAALYPDDERPSWRFCAPRLEWGSEQLTAIRATLLDRAAAAGHGLSIDPDLHLVVDGERVPPEWTGNRTCGFTVPAGAGEVRLVSRVSVPAEVVAASDDTRRLGVPIERLKLYDADFLIEASHRHSGLCDGFYGCEPELRWTDGNARLPEMWRLAFAGAFTLEIRLAPTELPYRAGHGDWQPSARRDSGEQRLPMMTGIVAGAIGEGGVLPAGWHVYSEADLRYAVVGHGEERGLAYIDIRVSGTPSATTNANQLFFADWRQIAAAEGEEWTVAAQVALLAGSLQHVQAVEIGAALNRADGEYSSWFGAAGLTPQVEPLGTRRFGLTRRVADRDAAYLMPLLQLAVTADRPVDLVLRLGQPLAEHRSVCGSTRPRKQSAAG